MNTLCFLLVAILSFQTVCSQTTCPSRNLTLIEDGRKCRKPCESDADCRGTLKRCLCDGLCGMSCFNPKALCLDLPGISNGRIRYGIGFFGLIFYSSGNASYGSKAVYRCNEGWYLSGEAVRTCRSDKKWSGTEPKCKSLQTCGQVGNDESTKRWTFGRVIGGKKAARRWPWQALVMVKLRTVFDSFANSFAGGSLINQHWVLTAAHVFDDYASIEQVMSRLAVAVGIVMRPRRGRNIDGNIKVFQPRKIVFHPGFDRNNRVVRTNFDYDVALIRIGAALRTIKVGRVWTWSDLRPEFDGTIPLSLYVRPVCLPCSDSCIPMDQYTYQNGSRLIEDNDSNDVKCQKKGKWLVDRYFDESRTPMIVTGFGFWSTTNQTLPFHLKEATLQILHPAICNEAVDRAEEESGHRMPYTDRMICARSPYYADTISDTCQGDSGGPLVREYKNPNTGESCWIQVGIVSYGFRCGEVHWHGFRYPGFYTDVSKVQGWIESTTNDDA